MSGFVHCDQYLSFPSEPSVRGRGEKWLRDEETRVTHHAFACPTFWLDTYLSVFLKLDR